VHLPDLNPIGVYMWGHYKFQKGKAGFVLEGSSDTCDGPFLYCRYIENSLICSNVLEVSQAYPGHFLYVVLYPEMFNLHGRIKKFPEFRHNFW
jgi:hypothetical protein